MSKKNRSVSEEKLGKVSGGDIFYDAEDKLWYVQDPEKGGVCYYGDTKSKVEKWAKDHNISTDEISSEKCWERFEDFIADD